MLLRMKWSSCIAKLRVYWTEGSSTEARGLEPSTQVFGALGCSSPQLAAEGTVDHGAVKAAFSLGAPEIDLRSRNNHTIYSSFRDSATAVKQFNTYLHTKSKRESSATRKHTRYYTSSNSIPSILISAMSQKRWPSQDLAAGHAISRKQNRMTKCCICIMILFCPL